jgi:hypothetical protein
VGLPFTRRKTSSTTLKKEEKIFRVWGSVSLPLFTDRASHLLLLKVVLKITKKVAE